MEKYWNVEKSILFDVIDFNKKIKNNELSINNPLFTSEYLEEISANNRGFVMQLIISKAIDLNSELLEFYCIRDRWSDWFKTEYTLLVYMDGKLILEIADLFPIGYNSGIYFLDFLRKNFNMNIENIKKQKWINSINKLEETTFSLNIHQACVGYLQIKCYEQ